MKSVILNVLQVDICNEYVTEIDQINQIFDAVSIGISKVHCYLFSPKNQISFVSDRMMSLDNSLSVTLLNVSCFLLIHLKHQRYALIHPLLVQIDIELIKSKVDNLRINDSSSAG
jgi:hypothetical protein